MLNYHRSQLHAICTRAAAVGIGSLLACGAVSIAADYARPLPLIKELSSPGRTSTFGMLKSGVSHLAWSQDGALLAGYVDNGLAIKFWSPDGKIEKTINRPNHFGLDSFVLEFLDGHRLLVTSPSAASNSIEDKDRIQDVAFSIIDVGTGVVTKNVLGPNPGRAASRDNIAVHIAISPDQRFAAVVFRKAADPHVAIYSVENWTRVASLDVGNNPSEPADLNFSPDGKTLAVVAGKNGGVMLFDSKSWEKVGTIEAYPEQPPPMHILAVTAVIFSPDSSKIAVGTFGGGTWTRSGSRFPGITHIDSHIEFPNDPLRIFQAATGKEVASVDSFPGGFKSHDELAWLPDGAAMFFVDAVGNLRFWRCFGYAPSDVVGAVPHANSLKLAANGHEIAVSYPDGVRLFDITAVQQ